MINKVIRDKSGCVNCMTDKSRFLKQNHNKKVVGVISILNFSYTSYYKTCWYFVKHAKKKMQRMLIQKC